MHRTVLLVTIFCFVKWIIAFDIDKTALTVNVKGSEITVTVPDESEVISGFFSTEFSDECSLGYSFVHNNNNSSSLNYKHDIKKELQNNDEIRIVGVFHTKDQVVRKTYDFKIDAQGIGVKQDISETDPTECNCIQSQTEMHYKVQQCSGIRIFSEDFDHTLSNWQHEVRSRPLSAALHQEFVAYVKDEENCYLKDGHLHLNAIWIHNHKNRSFHLKDCTSRDTYYRNECGEFHQSPNVILPPVFTAKLHSKDAFSFKYGRVEIRARLPIGDWLFPYLILHPANRYNEDCFVNHIRIAYARGNANLQDKHRRQIGGRMVFGSAVLWPNDKAPTEYMQSTSELPGYHYGQEFHNYTMIWRRDRIIFKVDGHTYGTIENKDVLEEFSQHECFIVLGLTAGGAINFPDDYVLKSHKFFRNNAPKAAFLFAENKHVLHTWSQPNLVIDYVHVYTIHENEV